MKHCIGRKAIGLIIGFLCLFTGKAQKTDLQFSHLTTYQGLVSDVIYCLMQDSQGFIWIGTKEGVNRYDGYALTSFELPGEAFKNPAHRRINALCEDKQGNIWIGTSNGMLKLEAETESLKHYDLPSGEIKAQSRYVNSVKVAPDGDLFVGTRNGIFQYNSKQDHFERYPYFPHHTKFNSYTKGERVVNALYFDRFGKLWVASAGNGVSLLDVEMKKRVVYVRQKGNDCNISSNYIESVYEDRFGVIWLATANGLNRFDREKESFTVFRNDPNQPESLGENYVTSICEDGQGNLFVGTKNGLEQFNRKNGTFSHFRNHPLVSETISNNNILCLLKEKSGTFWIGTMLGLNWLSPKSLQFQLYQNIPDDETSLSNNILRAVVEDGKGVIWIGTMKDGINRLDPLSGRFRTYRMTSRISRNEKYNAIRTCCVDRNGQVLFGTDGGVLRYDPKTDKFQPYSFDDHLTFRKGVFAILHAHDNTYWLAEIDRGLLHYDPVAGTVREFKKQDNDTTSLSSTNIKVLFQSRKGDIWIGTHLDGASRLNKGGKTFTHYRPESGKEGSLSDPRVFAFHEDARGRLWLGTGMGLNRYLPESDSFQVFLKEDGLPGNVILSIQEDALGRLWLGTNRGLSCFNPESNRFVNFDQEDGLQGNVFEYQVACTARTGRMYVGGNNGLNSFDPETFCVNSFLPQVTFTGLKSGGREIHPGVRTDGRVLLSNPISRSGELVLNSDDRDILLEFSAMSFVDPAKNRYQYRLLPVDSAWQLLPEREHQLLLPQLDRGEYTLEVKASNNNALWNPQSTRLTIRVSPDWDRYLGWLLNLAVFSGLLFLGYVLALKGKKLIFRSLVSKSATGAEVQQPAAIVDTGNYEVPANLKNATENLLKQMGEHRWYLDKKLTKNQLAFHLDISVSQLSAILRDGLQVNFNDFVNQFRVKAVKEKFLDPKSRDYTLLGIAEECGFNSKTSFYRTFKKFTGLTPSEYLDQMES